MASKVTIRDVAAAAGVSATTVSHVLNATRYVSPGIIERVKNAVSATGYKQNMLAKAMRQGKSRTIGIIVHSVNVGNFYGNALHEIEEIMKGGGYDLLIRASHNDAHQQEMAIEKLLSWNVDGMIIVPSDNDYDYSQIPCPVVLIDREPKQKTVSGFFIDNYDITRTAMSDLIQHGHRHIAFMGAVPKFSPTMDRVRGYRDALREAGLPSGDDYMCCSDVTQEMGAEWMRYLLNETDVTAALIASSPMTVGAMSYIHAQNIPIPGRMAIVSYGDYDWMPLCNPPLNGILQPNKEVGRLAAQHLLSMLNDPEHTPFVSRRLKCTYIKGKSV